MADQRKKVSGCLRWRFMKLVDCPHKPPCPDTSSRWRCGQRTAIENGVNRGLITRVAGHSLLLKYGLPMTPLSRVNVGQAPAGATQRKLV